MCSAAAPAGSRGRWPLLLDERRGGCLAGHFSMAVSSFVELNRWPWLRGRVEELLPRQRVAVEQRRLSLLEDPSVHRWIHDRVP